MFCFPGSSDRNHVPEQGVAAALAAVAGFLDVVGYLTLHRLFTAHMTGNASKLGVALGRGDLGAAAPLAAAPLLFVAGVAAGTALADAGARRLAVGLQALLVCAYMGYGAAVFRHGAAPDRGAGGFWVLAAIAILALGLQTAALTKVGGETIRTTYVSGMLTRLGQALVRGRRDAYVGLVAAIWVAYVGGATAASYALGAIGIWCLGFPLAALVVLAAALR